MKTLFISLTTSLILSNLAFADPNLNQAADDVCKCLEAPQKQARKAMELIHQAQASGDMSQLMSAQGEMMGVIGESGRCFDALAKKYPEIDQSNELQSKVMAMAEQQCPNPATNMPMN